MKEPIADKVTSDFIKGVNLPLVEAEPDVVAAFHKHYAEAINGAETAVDRTEEIENILRNARGSSAELKR